MLFLCVGLAAMISVGTLYSQQQESQEVIAKADTAKPKLDLFCQKKLLGYLQQGGVDIEAKMHYGDLQSCDFSSQSEQVRLAESKRSWSMQPSN